MILLPNIEEIGAQAFINNSFIEVALSDKLTIIRNETFKNCSKLNNVTGLKKVEEIGAQAFMNSSIKEISLYNKIRVKAVVEMQFVFPTVLGLDSTYRREDEYELSY